MPLKRLAPSFVVQLGLPGDSLCPIRILTRKLSRLQVAPTAIARNPVSLASSKRVSDAEHEHSGVLANVASSLKFENAHSASAQITDLTQPMPSVHPALQFAHLELSRLFRASWFFSWFSREMHIRGTLPNPPSSEPRSHSRPLGARPSDRTTIVPKIFRFVSPQLSQSQFHA